MEAIIIAIISLIGSVILGVLQLRKVKSEAIKSDTESANTIADAAIKLLAPYKAENEVLAKKVAELTNKNDNLIKENLSLNANMAVLNAKVLELENEVRLLKNKLENKNA